MKKILSFAAMMLLVTASASAYSFKSGNLCYNIVSGTNTVRVTYEKWATPSYNNLSGAITVPQTVKNGGKTYTVVGLETNTFSGCPITSVSLPPTVNSIGSSAFDQCSSLTSVNIPDGVTVIREYCFNCCRSLKSIVIPNSVTKLEDFAFRYCDLLESVTMSDNVTSFGMDAFLSCISLRSIRIPAVTTNIGQTAFSSPSLEEIITEIQDPSKVSINYWAFMTTNKETCRLIVPQGKIEAYRNADVWNQFVNIIDSQYPDPNPNPTWNRYDANGVGYAFEFGGNGFSSTEGASSLCDNDASTRFIGRPAGCWCVIQASKEVAVSEYTLVTANESRQNYGLVPRSWRLQGSNDFENWTDIDVRKDYPMPFMDQTEVVIPVKSTKKYRYFRFMVDSGSAGDVQLSEVWINKQNHVWRAGEKVDPGCGKEGMQIYQCPDCHAYKYELIEPTGYHNFYSGVCAGCGIEFGQERLIYNAQDLTHYVKALHQYRGSDQTWPSAPEGWNNVSFNDQEWIDLPLPTASPNHSQGPFESLHYNSNWYGEYNSYLMRFPVYLSRITNGAEFTFRYVHDDNMKVYVNGQEVINLEGWSSTPSGCTWASCSSTSTIPASAFKVGKNIVAVYMQQNYGGSYFDCELTASGVTVGSAQQGDVNGDGKVNVSDVSALINMIMGITAMDQSAADVNGDGRVNVSDVSALINIILGIQ
ncbi:MAG: leucine-rich repeat protein [Muribaculaceae bacterium]|nr:leucine-rich repeat protein [Muribaculaceae bacterium]